MWRKSDESKLKSSPGASTSPDPSAQHPGTAAPSDTSSALDSVSQGINIKGELSGQGDFFLDGVFEGKIHIPHGTFTVGPNARVTAEIEAREIVVRGEVIGTLKAHERIRIWSTAKVTGDMDTRGIMIEDGAILHSNVGVPKAVAPQAAARKVAASQAQASAGAAPLSEAVVPQEATRKSASPEAPVLKAGAHEPASLEVASPKIASPDAVSLEKGQPAQPSSPQPPSRAKGAAVGAEPPPTPPKS
ncbi:MAG TPA: polymer-forming cytoskeletal protein [Candidatus Acidoferrum sp.]|nr:polymer-forming cytoskeletal protein [Candidatus Acidoferrum sp.]